MILLTESGDCHATPMALPPTVDKSGSDYMKANVKEFLPRGDRLFAGGVQSQPLGSAPAFRWQRHVVERPQWVGKGHMPSSWRMSALGRGTKPLSR